MEHQTANTRTTDLSLLNGRGGSRWPQGGGPPDMVEMLRIPKFDVFCFSLVNWRNDYFKEIMLSLSLLYLPTLLNKLKLIYI